MMDGTHAAHPPRSSLVVLILLTVGVVFLPIIGPLIGVAMLWESRAWALREKALGTLLPFEVGALVAMVFLPASMSRPSGPTIVWHLAVVAIVAAAALYTLVALVGRRRSA